MTTWIAFLRGINVGGANKVPMAELRATVESLGHADVATYIQSGNVVFRADVTDEATVAAGLADAIAERHQLQIPVVVRSAEDLERIARTHPDADGDVEPKFLHVVFLSAEPDAGATDSLDPRRFEPDRWVLDGREIYACYPHGSGRSKLTLDVFERTLGVAATARNLNTVHRMVEMSHPTA